MGFYYVCFFKTLCSVMKIDLDSVILAGGYYGLLSLEIGLLKFLLNQFKGIKQKLF